MRGFVAIYVLARSWWRSGTSASLRQANCRLLHNRDFGLPSPHGPLLRLTQAREIFFRSP
jgi:hypothetical protein